MAVDRMTGLPSMVSSVIVPTKAMSPAQLDVTPSGLPVTDCAPMTTWLYSAANLAVRSVPSMSSASTITLGGSSEPSAERASRRARLGATRKVTTPRSSSANSALAPGMSLGSAADSRLRASPFGHVHEHRVGPQQQHVAGPVADGRDITHAEDPRQRPLGGWLVNGTWRGAPAVGPVVPFRWHG